MKVYDKYKDLVTLAGLYESVRCNKFDSILSEANLSNAQDLLTSIDSVMTQKGIDKASPIYKWFTTQYIKWYKSPDGDQDKDIQPHNYQDGEPQWMSSQGIVDFVGFNQDAIDQIDRIIMFFNTLSEKEQGKLDRIPFNMVLQKAQEAEEYTAKNTSPLKEGEDYRFLRKGTYKDSKGKPLSLVELLTNAAFKFEGNEMGHCLKDGRKYNTNRVRIFSLYDANNMPHITFEVGKNKNVIKQIKGKENSAPAAKYQEATKQATKDLIKAGYVVENDGTNIGMIPYDGVYYFTDTPEWEEIYNREIKPKQDKVFDEIKNRIEII